MAASYSFPLLWPLAMFLLLGVPLRRVGILLFAPFWKARTRCGRIPLCWFGQGADDDVLAVSSGLHFVYLVAACNL